MTYPNGLESKFAYDTLNRVTGLSNASANYTYTLDGTVGNRTGVTEQLATQAHPRIVGWGYDNIYRLTNENITADPNSKTGSVTYGLDPVGNRLSLGLSQGSNLPGISPIQFGSITYDPDDRLNTETYDANGNTLITGGKVFAYDFENRLKSLNNGAVTIQYDADGNRVAKTVAGVTTRYLVDDLNPTGYAQVVEEVTGTTASRTYTYGLQRISQYQQIANAWTPSFYGYDGGGTVRLLADSTGTVTDTYDYDAWGNTVNTTGSTPNVYVYRAEQYDPDLALYYLRARYTNPATGRFLSRDTFLGITTDPITLHKYLYANSNPVNMSDPTGRGAAVETALLHPISAPVGAGLGTAGSVAAGGVIMPLTGAMVAAGALEIDCMWELAGSWLELAAQHASGINFNGVLSAGPPGRWMRLVCSVKEGKGYNGNRCGPFYQDHHMIPQAVGPIVDPIISPKSIDDDWNIWCCPPDTHLDGLHGGGPRGGDWNDAWRQCLGRAPGPSQVWGCLSVIKGMFSDLLKKCKPLVAGPGGGPRFGGM